MLRLEPRHATRAGCGAPLMTVASILGIDPGKTGALALYTPATGALGGAGWVRSSSNRR